MGRQCVSYLSVLALTKSIAVSINLCGFLSMTLNKYLPEQKELNEPRKFN